jgi:enolase
MQTITIELTDNTSLKYLQDLERKNLIKIVNNNYNSYALAGENLSEEDFKEWIEYAEQQPSTNLKDAKKIWATQKKKLQKIIQ